MTTLQQIAGIHYHIKLPKQVSSEKPSPAAILIHGWGGDEKAMRFFDQTIPGGVAIIRPRAPICLADGAGYGWFDTRGLNKEARQTARVQAIDTLSNFLRALPEKQPIDAGRLLLIGFSQGGIMSNYIALTQPDLIIGNASLAAKVAKIPTPLQSVNSLESFPIFIAHGITDDVIPLEDGRAAHHLFSRLNANVTYGEYDIGHKMNSQAVKDLKTWVAAVFASGLAL